MSSEEDKRTEAETDADDTSVGRSEEDDGLPPAHLSRDSEKQGATPKGADLEDDEEEKKDDEVDFEPTIGGNIKDKEEEDRKEARRKAALLCCVCCILIVLIVLMIVFFAVDEGDTARAQLAPTEPTESPTYFPTSGTGAPTESPVTSAPSITAQPTVSPTPLVTFPPTDGQVSRFPCAEIRVQDNVTAGHFGENNFKNYSHDNVEICGDTFGGVDPDRPERSQWSVRNSRRDCPTRNYQEGFEFCDSVGARWCTVEELAAEVAAATGCGGDRGFVYTNTPCDAEGDAGIFMFDLGLRDSKQPFFKCETDLVNTQSVLRCCGDNYWVEG